MKRRDVTSALLALALVTVTLVSLPSPTLTFWLEWGPDLEGPWCATRPVGQDCCDDRNDDCSVPILGTECYCDVFCNDTAHDCCPDYFAHCQGVTRPPPITTTPRTTPCKLLNLCVQFNSIQ
jgi:hypothetical protein